ncbi:MAG TPA: LacI family DNA-binding transcriptional regulator [Spirochaetia bacterium]|nr:LacI family DNA-binding transcriptional regulator [Spirochaetia bacterium]
MESAVSGGIREVARLAGVSISTVSRVINDSKPVRQEIRSRVLEAVDAVGYVPNRTAQSMVSGRTMTVGIVVPSGASSFNSLVLSGIREELYQHSYQSIICEIENPISVESEVRYLDLLSRGITDGIILMHEAQSPKIREALKRVAIPIVVASVEIRGARLRSIGINDRAAARDATNYLVSLGHRRIGVIGAGKQIASGINRTNGFNDALKEHGLPFTPSRIVPGWFSFESGYRATRQLLRNDSTVTAIFCLSDEMAIGAVRYLKDEGLRVPDDVSVMGFDDVALATYTDPQLTTTRQPIRQIGSGAADLLMRIIRKESRIPKRVVLDHTIVVRSSCAAPRSRI